MAPLPPLPPDPPPAQAEAMAAVAAARSHSDGSPELATVYQALFHQPALAPQVAALGEAIRFHGRLPDDVRELVILRYSARQGYGYEWSHHQRPAALAGIDAATVAAVTRLEIPESLRADQRAALRAVDAVVAGESLPQDAQELLGPDRSVELVVTCGLYAIMGYTVTSFDVPLEPHLPRMTG